MTAADWPSGWSALKKLMWFVSTRKRRMPSAATIDEPDRDRQHAARMRAREARDRAAAAR